MCFRNFLRSVVCVSFFLSFLTIPIALAQTSSAGLQQAPATSSGLTNKDVVGMLKAGLPADIIIAKISGSPCSFDTSPGALEQLKTAGVPDAVIMAMVKASGSAHKPSASPNGVSPQANGSAPAVSVTIPDGTPLEVELKATVSSEDVHEGDAIDFSVVRPVVVKGVTVIEKGAPATARIIKVKKARHWGRAGQISWAM